jgi:hypothetical protein
MALFSQNADRMPIVPYRPGMVKAWEPGTASHVMMWTPSRTESLFIMTIPDKDLTEPAKESPFDLKDTHPERKIKADPGQAELQRELDRGLKDSFPASDPVAVSQPTTAGPTEDIDLPKDEDGNLLKKTRKVF